ncbi:MAG: gamma carbonic anhydrase family protein [Myxococcales bacterium 68-20]|nr:gamma carbonic anhydrase family protein [Myxococcales bacterium]OJY29612.1 MAG: gamma carbonic anhydrase family protein [Myxococcales bacterium 68-20]
MPIYSHKGVTPRIGERVYLAPNATVIGDVVIGDDSSVWFGAVLRGDVFPIRIGARTNIQDNAVVHVTGGKAETSIGDDVTVGHLALIHGCTVGNRCLVGMGSIVLDGAVVEDECFIAAGALVPPGMRVARRSLMVGRPARMARVLDDAALADIANAGALYMQYARDFATDLKLV